MSAPQVRLIRHASGDWEALYINGEVVRQDHTIDADDLIFLLGEYAFDIDSRVINEEEGVESYYASVYGQRHYPKVWPKDLP